MRDKSNERSKRIDKMPINYIDDKTPHYRVYDTMGRVRAYATQSADFGPIPQGWTIRKYPQ